MDSVAETLEQYRKGDIMKLTRLALTAGLILIGITVMAGEPNQAKVDHENQVIRNPQQLSFELNTTYQVFDHTIDLWHDAVLKRDEKQTNFFLDEIYDIVAEDIQSDKLQMKMLVRQIEHCYRENSSEGKNLLEGNHAENEDLTRYKKYLPILSSSVCIKEELFRAINRTEAFSNKYRLLGDYGNLLRRELGMPKLNMADIPSEKGKQTLATE